MAEHKKDRELPRAKQPASEDPMTQAAQVSQFDSQADSVVIGATPVTGDEKTIEVAVRDRGVVVTLGSESIRFDRDTAPALSQALNKAFIAVA